MRDLKLTPEEPAAAETAGAGWRYFQSDHDDGAIYRTKDGECDYWNVDSWTNCAPRSGGSLTGSHYYREIPFSALPAATRDSLYRHAEQAGGAQ